MSRAVLAAFAGPEPLLAAARDLRDKGRPALDAFTPFPVEGLAEALQLKPSGAPWAMLIGGLGTAGGFYLLEALSSVFFYPFDQGSRPLNSWPTFLLAPAEIGVFAAALTGFIYFLVKTGLPRLHHPLFGQPRFERATQDEFMLASPVLDGEAGARQRQELFAAGAVWVEEVEL